MLTLYIISFSLFSKHCSSVSTWIDWSFLATFLNPSRILTQPVKNEILKGGFSYITWQTIPQKNKHQIILELTYIYYILQLITWLHITEKDQS